MVALSQRIEGLADEETIELACWVTAESRFFWIRIQKNLDSRVSRTCRSASRGNHWFAGLADRHLGETTGFPDLLVGISGKPLVSRTCWSASRGNHWFPGLAGRHLGETTGFPDLLISISGKPVVSPTCYFTLSIAG